MKAQFAKRREYVLERIARLPGVTCVPPGGAFYAFMNVSAHFGRTLAASRSPTRRRSASRRWPRRTSRLVMGSAFGAEGYARLSFATDLTTLERGFDAPRELSPQLAAAAIR